MLTVETVSRIRCEHFVKGKRIREISRDLKVSRKVARGLGIRDAPLFDQRTASSLNSRVNFRLSIIYLRFHHDTLTRCPRERALNMPILRQLYPQTGQDLTIWSALVEKDLGALSVDPGDDIPDSRFISRLTF
jgi:hypothetical protein